MTVITRIEVATAAVPLPVTTGISSRTITERQYTLVRVTGDDGVSGIGFCYPGHKAARLATLAIAELLGPLVLGSDAHHVEGTWSRLYQEALLHGRTGSVMRALSALDIALWDRNARAAGLPLHKFLGGVADEVAAYASGGYYRDGKGPDELADEVRGYVESGFEAVKIKVGRLSLAEDTERIAAARAAVGPDVLLMLDANNAFRDLPTALRAVEAWAGFDPYFIEEPFSPDDLVNHGRLASATSIPVATGEIEAGKWRTKELLDHGGAIILQQDAAVCGGITELRKIAHLADAYGVTVSPHWFHDLHAPLVGALSSARFVEYFVGRDVFNFGTLIDTQLAVTPNGRLELHTTPGLGFDFIDEDGLSSLLEEPWRTLEPAS